MLSQHLVLGEFPFVARPVWEVECARPFFHVCGPFPFVSRTISIFKDSCSVTHSVLPLSNVSVHGLKRGARLHLDQPHVLAFAVLQTVLPTPNINFVLVVPHHLPLPMQLPVFPFSFVDISGPVRHGSKAVSSIVAPFTLILLLAVAVVQQHAFAMPLSEFPLSLIGYDCAFVLHLLGFHDHDKLSIPVSKPIYNEAVVRVPAGPLDLTSPRNLSLYHRSSVADSICPCEKPVSVHQTLRPHPFVRVSVPKCRSSFPAVHPICVFPALVVLHNCLCDL
mmetsp:Transcript_51208/g.121268  ORF Transcript_51208/g.121268 Transcript_51208/m.121268 type:complete len:278 (+) Transcript_51208:146-979(+)